MTLEDFKNDIEDWCNKYNAEKCVEHLIDILSEKYLDSDIEMKDLQDIANSLWEYEDW